MAKQHIEVINSAIKAVLREREVNVEYKLVAVHRVVNFTILKADVDLFANYLGAAKKIARLKGRRAPRLEQQCVQIDPFNVGVWFTGEARELMIDLRDALNVRNNNFEGAEGFCSPDYWLNINIGSEEQEFELID